MVVRVDSGLRRVGPRSKAQKIKRGARIRPQTLISEPQHKNIGTLIFFLVTILLGLGAGWLAGNVLSNTINPTPVFEEVQAKTQTIQPASPDLEHAAAQPQNTAQPQNIAQPPNAEVRGDKEEAKSTERRRAGSRRSYVRVQNRESLPVAVIKGKPLKKAFKQVKKVRFW